MTTSIDSNVLAALWSKEDRGNEAAVKMLGEARKRGNLVVSAPVYSELMAGPLREEAALDAFFAETDIAIEWKIGEDVWREAGKAYGNYAQRRISSGGQFPKRILADFVIGAHALLCGHTLLTLDKRRYAAAFPTLTIVSD
jgi:predicted nucleic acid-binding protein